MDPGRFFVLIIILLLGGLSAFNAFRGTRYMEQRDSLQVQVEKLATSYQEHLVVEYAKEKCGLDRIAVNQQCFDSVRERAKREVEAAKQ